MGVSFEHVACVERPGLAVSIYIIARISKIVLVCVYIVKTLPGSTRRDFISMIMCVWVCAHFASL